VILVACRFFFLIFNGYWCNPHNYRVNNRFSVIDRRLLRHRQRFDNVIIFRTTSAFDDSARRCRPTTPMSAAVRGPPTIGSGRRQAAVQFGQSAQCLSRAARTDTATAGPEFSSVARVTPAVSNNMKQQLDEVSDNRCFGGQQKVYEHDRSVATLCVVLLLSMHCKL